MQVILYVLSATLLLILSGCGGHTTRVIDTPETRELKGWQKPYEVDGQRYDPLRDHQGFVQTGIASWYGKKFHGRKTSNGEIYDMYAMTAAHKTLPMGVDVRVSHLQTGRSILVRVNDRGPFVAGRIIDLSYSAASQLGIVEAGTAQVRIEALGYRRVEDGQISYRSPTSYDAGSFAVQIGAFGVADNANRLAARMQQRYGKSEVQEATIDGRTYYRVRVGNYRSLKKADQAAETFSSSGFPGSYVVAFDSFMLSLVSPGKIDGPCWRPPMRWPVSRLMASRSISCMSSREPASVTCTNGENLQFCRRMIMLVWPLILSSGCTRKQRYTD